VIGDSFYDRLMRIIGKSQVHIQIDCWGANLIMANHLGTPNHMMLALLPIDDQHTRMFTVSVVHRSKNRLLDALFGNLMLYLMHQATMLFLRTDFSAIQGMKFMPSVLLPDCDGPFIQWYQYWQKLPRSSFQPQRKSRACLAANHG